MEHVQTNDPSVKTVIFNLILLLIQKCSANKKNCVCQPLIERSKVLILKNIFIGVFNRLQAEKHESFVLYSAATGHESTFDLVGFAKYRQ